MKPKVTARIVERDGVLIVSTRWNMNVQRKNGINWEIPKERTDLAARLFAAINAQKALTFERIGKDIYGKTYVIDRMHVLGKTLNADLKRLGF